MKNTRGKGLCVLSIFLSLFLVAATVSCDSFVTEDATAPTISVQPENKSGSLNSTITLSVAATSADGGTLSYQWWSSTTASTTGGTLISGATNQSYTVPTTKAGTFFFFCVITNTNQNITGDGEKTASTTSSIATVIVTKPVDAATPAVLISDNVTVNVNSSATLTVTATTTDSGTLTYQWYSNSSASTEGSTVISGATSASYSVTATASGTTYYYCVVTNTIADNGDSGAKTASKTSAIAKITVSEPVDAATPVVTISDNVTVNVNSSATITVTAAVTDSGTLTYQWYSNSTESTEGGTAISEATSTSYSVTATASGTTYYYCVVTNTIADNGDGGTKTASKTSSIAKITVSEPVDATTPAVTISDNVNVNTNSSATLTVTATSSDSGTLTYQWYSNSTESTEGGTAVSGATSASYSVTPTTVGTTYYYCVVKNTIADNGDGGAKTASKTSSIATITVLSTGSVSVTIPSDKELSISGWTSKCQDGSWGNYALCATSGFSTYKWYVDGVPTEDLGNWVTIPYTISVGIHEVTVVATDSDGNIYSASCNIESMGKGV